MNFLSLNRSLTNLGGEMRQFRLPRMNPFPKLDGPSGPFQWQQRRTAACVAPCGAWRRHH